MIPLSNLWVMCKFAMWGSLIALSSRSTTLEKALMLYIRFLKHRKNQRSKTPENTGVK